MADGVVLEGEADEVSFFCGNCSVSFDEKSEFVQHLETEEHLQTLATLTAALKKDKPFCFLCLVGFEEETDYSTHSTAEEHAEFFKTMVLIDSSISKTKSFLVTLSPDIEAKNNEYLKFREHVLGRKIMGLGHIRRKEDDWVCELCLEIITDKVDEHCNKAIHAIQCVKVHDPETAFTLKKFALSKQDRSNKKFKSLILATAKQIFEKEKETTEFARFMSEYRMSALQSMDTLTPDANSDSQTSQNSKTPEAETTNKMDTDKNYLSLSDDALVDNNKDYILLFEDSDREAIPELSTSFASVKSEEPKETKVKEPSPEPPKRRSLRRGKALKQMDSNLLIGVGKLQKRGRTYFCKMCDIAGKTTPFSVKTHFTSSLHRKNMVCEKYPQSEVHNFLEHVRTRDATRYNALLRNESKKIEQEERKDEADEMVQIRASILNTQDDLLPPVAEPDETVENLLDLAQAWNSEETKQLFTKLNPSTEGGANKQILSPITPVKDTLLVGVSWIKQSDGQNFHCTLCDIKWGINGRYKQRGHVNGRLHKFNALCKAYGPTVKEYLDHRISRESYDAVHDVINKSCILLEKDEIETENADAKNIRSKILGLNPGQIHLPVIVMSNEKPFDVKLAATEWKNGKKPGTMVNIKVTINNKDVTAKKEPSEKPNVSENSKKNESPRNIFELCKPLEVTPESVTFENKKSTGVKNIDIASLQKSLIDADFIPVESKPGTASKGDLPPKSVSSGTPKSGSISTPEQPTSATKQSIKKTIIRKPVTPPKSSRPTQTKILTYSKVMHKPKDQKPSPSPNYTPKPGSAAPRNTPRAVSSFQKIQKPGPSQHRSNIPNKPNDSRNQLNRPNEPQRRNNFDTTKSNFQDAVNRTANNVKSQLSHTLAMVTNLNSIPSGYNTNSQYPSSSQMYNKQYPAKQQSFSNYSDSVAGRSAPNSVQQHGSFGNSNQGAVQRVNKFQNSNQRNFDASSAGRGGHRNQIDSRQNNYDNRQPRGSYGDQNINTRGNCHAPDKSFRNSYDNQSANQREEYSNQHGSYDNQYDGHDNQRGGFNNQRGGYDNQRGGHGNRRGGFENRRGGYDNQRVGYDNQRSGGYGNQHGGYDNQRSGYDNQRSGYDNQHGGYDSGYGKGAGGYDSQRGGYGNQRMNQATGMNRKLDDAPHMNRSLINYQNDYEQPARRRRGNSNASDFNVKRSRFG